jgi:tRNA modification GTPase
MYSNDTIAAIATAPGPAGVCVIRISGNEALHVADGLVPLAAHKPSRPASGTFFYADIVHPRTGEKVDDVVILVFRAPRSFTGEDVVEIQGHGGTLPSRLLLEAILAAGARLAEPGEFSKRAFLNGRLDLTQAEAICDFIQAKSERMAHVARAQLDGSLGVHMTALYEAVLAQGADVEHQLDFDEGELSERFLEQTAQAVKQTLDELTQVLHSWNTEGHLLREGALVVLSGKPNAGKSSLLNAMLGRNRAIVHHIPGTTRDVIEENALIEGLPIRLVDTAGLRDTADDVEQEGILRTHALIKQADVNLHLLDATTATPEEVAAIAKDPRSLCLFTKADLLIAPNAQHEGALLVSAKTGAGLAELGKAILSKLGISHDPAGIEIVNQRHAQEIHTAHGCVERALSLLHTRDLVLAANELRVAAEALGRITGRCYSEDLLDTIFSRFCVGK